MHNRGLRMTVLIAGGAMVLAFAAVMLPAYAATTQTSSATSDDPILVGAGDIATCSSLGGAESTAKLLDKIPGTVFSAGDNSQDSGAYEQYLNCFDPTWGRHKDRMRPAPGNHDSMTPGAAGYYRYFGAAAGEPGKGYYSYDLGNWHIVALNSNCYDVGGCGAGSAEERWLRADLAASAKPCTAAYWHHPVFTSSMHTDGYQAKPLFKALYDFGAEIVMNGHNHVYERFAPMNPDGAVDQDFGIREFDVGTGGTSHYSFSYFPSRGSEMRNNDSFGVLKLTLRESGYDWEFVPVEGAKFTDSGSGRCHPPISQQPSASPPVSSSAAQPSTSPSVSTSPASPSVSSSVPSAPASSSSVPSSSVPSAPASSSSPSAPTWPWWPWQPTPSSSPSQTAPATPTPDWPWRPTLTPQPAGAGARFGAGD